MSRRTFVLLLLVTLAAGATLRTLWLRADPPQITVNGVGIVWHDEGAWTHNARNRALWGAWRTDDWNPVFIAPVFTALEYASFREFGVGLWQARLVSVAAGLVAVGCLVGGLAALGTRRTALIGGLLLATNYAFVMWNRAALMESTMTAFIVAGWAAYAAGEKRPAWGLVAGAAAVLAWFTKASAAFFAAAIVLDAAASLVFARSRGEARAAAWTLAGFAAAALAVVGLFVWPHWGEYVFYNWQMSVVRKPEYDLGHLLDRASWLPIVESFFMRMWLVLAAAAVSIAAVIARWRTARPAERLLVLWVLVGLLELVIHDSGNERRYVMFIPALIALAALLAGRSEPVLPADLLQRRWSRALAVPLLLFLGYLVVGAAARTVYVDDIARGSFHHVVFHSTVLAVLATILVVWQWPRMVGWLAARRVAPPLVAVLVALAVAWNVFEYASWARTRRYLNFQASIALGRLLPDGTLVQGKLANGLALDNRIRPIFIGNHFGNYDDRLRRDDVRYILTYDLPSIGYESQVSSGLIQELLDHYPGHHTIATFDVDETPEPDRAVLVDKRPK
ncbi:MAG TPA: glycosyltransferase family 39 protein [Vicinamibacterales bacterium]|nr:glycosyltransferase family 39 protein [Vicinamibacterales bacterium]